MDSLPLRIINVVTNVLVGVIVVFALLIVVGKPFGFHAYAVLSGSMEPEYHTGSLIYVKEVKPSTLGQGDVITFMTGKDTTVTHRIVDEVQGEDGVTRFQTQGDANTSPDGELVHPDNVIGTPVIQIPMLGYVVNFIQFPPGTYVAISVCAIAVFLMFLPDLFSKGDEDEECESESDAYSKQPRRQQGQHPQGYPQQGRQGQYPQGQPMQRRLPASGQQLAQRPQAAHAQGRQMAQRPQAQDPQPRRAHQQGSQVTRFAQQARPAQQQARSAQVQSPAANVHVTTQRSAAATNAAGANNPRLRNSQNIRSTQNAAQTNSQQAQPARRPVS